MNSEIEIKNLIALYGKLNVSQKWNATENKPSLCGTVFKILLIKRQKNEIGELRMIWEF